MKREGVTSSIRGFQWFLATNKGVPGTSDGMRINLISPRGQTAATVFLTYDLSGFNWFVWDRDGVGGENSQEPSVELSMREAEAATLRWGKHTGKAQ